MGRFLGNMTIIQGTGKPFQKPTMQVYSCLFFSNLYFIFGKEKQASLHLSLKANVSQFYFTSIWL